jgi:hypothetical protein
LIIAAVREILARALLLALQCLPSVTAVGALLAIISFYTLVAAAGFYGSAWLVRAAMDLLTSPI